MKPYGFINCGEGSINFFVAVCYDNGIEAWASLLADFRVGWLLTDEVPLYKMIDHTI
jgi:hypothetical protein